MELSWFKACLGSYVLFSCLVEVLSAFSCQHSGDCSPGFFCHAAAEMCISCEKCSKERNNLALCSSECFPVKEVMNPSKGIHPLLKVLLPSLLAITVIAGVVAAVLYIRHKKQKSVSRPVMESNPDQRPQLGPDEHDNSITAPLVTGNQIV